MRATSAIAADRTSGSRSVAAGRDRLIASLSRGELAAGLVLLGSANALVQPVGRSIRENGLWTALAGTFDVSVIVWLALIAAPALMIRSSAQRRGRADEVVGWVAFLSFLIPLPHASWVGLTALALYLIYDPGVRWRAAPDPFLRRGAIILLATATAMFWGRVVLQNSGDFVLAADASFVSLLTGMTHAGNVIRTAGDEGYLWIAPYCSSLSNVSLAILCSALVVQWRDLAWTRSQFGRCLLAVLAVIAINDMRISIMVVRPELYELVHGSEGALVANLLTVAAIAFTILYGNDRDPDRTR